MSGKPAIPAPPAGAPEKRAAAGLDHKRLRLSSRQGDEQQRPEFNTTSMTDVIFILLIFFISLSQLRTAHIEVDVPEVAADPQELPPDDGPPQVVEIAKDGTVYLDGVVTEVPALVGALTAERARRGREPRIRIRGDREGNYGKFVEVMFSLSQAELRQIEIAVQAKR